MTDKLLPGSLRSATDLFGKLIRDTEILEEGVTSDRFFNFVVTGYSLIDWIKHDPTVPASAKADVEELRKDKWIRLCGDLAIAAKHFSLTQRKPTASEVRAEQGWGVGRFGKGPYGVGEERIFIHMPDGSSHNFLELVHGVMKAWIGFFRVTESRHRDLASRCG